MHGLAYTNRYKRVLSHKKTKKSPSFYNTSHTQSETGDTQNHLAAPVRIPKHQQSALPKRSTRIQHVQNFATFSHHTPHRHHCATTRCKLQKWKCAQAKFSY